MLVLSRRRGESIVIRLHGLVLATVTVAEVRGPQVRIIPIQDDLGCPRLAAVGANWYLRHHAARCGLVWPEAREHGDAEDTEEVTG